MSFAMTQEWKTRLLRPRSVREDVRFMVAGGHGCGQGT